MNSICFYLNSFFFIFYTSRSGYFMFGFWHFMRMLLVQVFDLSDFYRTYLKRFWSYFKGYFQNKEMLRIVAFLRKYLYKVDYFCVPFCSPPLCSSFIKQVQHRALFNFRVSNLISSSKIPSSLKMPLLAFPSVTITIKLPEPYPLAIPVAIARAGPRAVCPVAETPPSSISENLKFAMFIPQSQLFFLPRWQSSLKFQKSAFRWFSFDWSPSYSLFETLMTLVSFFLGIFCRTTSELKNINPIFLSEVGCTLMRIGELYLPSQIQFTTFSVILINTLYLVRLSMQGSALPSGSIFFLISFSCFFQLSDIFWYMLVFRNTSFIIIFSSLLVLGYFFFSASFKSFNYYSMDELLSIRNNSNGLSLVPATLSPYTPSLMTTLTRFLAKCALPFSRRFLCPQNRQFQMQQPHLLVLILSILSLMSPQCSSLAYTQFQSSMYSLSWLVNTIRHSYFSHWVNYSISSYASSYDSFSISELYA